jgi:hypothetical protein
MSATRTRPADAALEQLEVAAYRVPTDAAEADGASADAERFAR